MWIHKLNQSDHTVKTDQAQNTIVQDDPYKLFGSGGVKFFQADDQIMDLEIADSRLADVSFPPGFHDLLDDIAESNGINQRELQVDFDIEGMAFYRLPSRPPEIEKIYTALDATLPIAHGDPCIRFPAQPPFIHRVHTASHIASPANKGELSHATLSAIPPSFASLKVSKRFIPKSEKKVVRWPLRVARNNELSARHILDLSYHQDALRTIASEGPTRFAGHSYSFGISPRIG